VELFVIAREMQYRARDHHVGELIGKRHPLNRLHAETVWPETVWAETVWAETVWAKPVHWQPANRRGIDIHSVHVVAFAQEIYEIAPVAAAGVENALPRVNAPAQQ